MPTFDIISEVESHSFTNAVDQANRVVATRFDFKGLEVSFERKDLTVTIFAESEYQIRQLEDMLRTALVKCKIDPQAMNPGKLETAGKQVKKLVTLQNGLDSDLAKKIVKTIKDNKFKVQSQIQGEKIRVTAKKRDDLQRVIALLRGKDFEQPLQFNNFRD